MKVENSYNSKEGRTDVNYLFIKFLNKILYTLRRKYDIHDIKNELRRAGGESCCGQEIRQSLL